MATPICIIKHLKVLGMTQDFSGYELLTLDDFKGCLSSFEGVRSLLGRKIRLHVYDLRTLDGSLRTLDKPSVLLSLIWALSLFKATVTDDHGNAIHITPVIFLQRILGFAQDFFFYRFTLKKIQSLLQRLDRAKAKPILNSNRKCLYLQTSGFGVRFPIGGDVAHILGVLNHIGHHFSSVELVIPDSIPMVDQAIKIHIIPPSPRYQDFEAMPSLFYNLTLYQAVLERMGSEIPGLIYQRYSLNNFTGAQLSQKYNCPFILEYNESQVWMHRTFGRSLDHESLSEQIEMLNLHSADLIVVVSQALQDQLVQRGIPAQKILVNPNGVDTDLYSPNVDGSAIRKQHRLKPEEIVIGFIGTFGKWHGAEVLADAFGQLLQNHPELRSHLRLLLIGDGATMAEVQHILKTHGVMDRCVLTGLVPQEDAPKYLGACDVLVSSHVPNPDGTPFFNSLIKLFEYMAMGKAIITSDLGQASQVLEHDRTAWMVPPSDAEALEAGLLLLIQDPERRQQLGAAARKEALAKHTWAEHTQRIMTKIQALCSATA